MSAVKIFQYEVKDDQNESDRKISDRKIAEFAESQKRTENKIGEMIQAQKKSDKKISEIAESQKESDRKISELAESQKELTQILKELIQAQKELTEVQKRTETRVGELADAQKRTEQEIAKLSSGLNVNRKQIGGLSKSMAYALENEAFRKLPAYLKNHFQIEVKERLIRASVGITEINIFAKAQQNGNEVIIVGECVLRLDDRSKLGQLAESVEIVKQHYNQPVVPLIITHFVQSDIFKKVSEEGIIVVQSFEWD